jgi:acyl-coenzyme A thioesterase PaaI-like protein
MAETDRAHAERVAQAREAARAADGPTAAKRELADALRALIEELPTTAADEAEIRALIGAVQSAAGRFAAAGRAPAARPGASSFAGMEDFLEKGPLIGLANPVAPPLEFWVDAEASLARGRGRFGRRYEGAPGLLHGGTLAAAFDELMGFATIFSGGPGMTRELTVRYLRPTPIEVELRFAARLDRVEGRRLFVSAEVEADGVRTAEASGTFTAVGGGTFEALARARREREGG